VSFAVIVQIGEEFLPGNLLEAFDDSRQPAILKLKRT